VAGSGQEGAIGMAGFAAIVLVCLATTPVDACNENTAVDMMSTYVANELKCATGWEDVIARSAQSRGVGTQTYVRTICRKLKDDE
jgi:hypothetical protein